MVQIRAKQMKSRLEFHKNGRFKINKIGAKIMEKCIKYAPNAKK